MEKEEILQVLEDNLGDGKYILAVLQLKKNMNEINKTELKDLTNALYSEQLEKKRMKDPSIKVDTKLISTRNQLDKITNRIEGAGLVNVREVGVIKMYSISPLGEELIRHMNQHK